jgi:hypothetical protein
MLQRHRLTTDLSRGRKKSLCCKTLRGRLEFVAASLFGQKLFKSLRAKVPFYNLLPAFSYCQHFSS